MTADKAIVTLAIGAAFRQRWLEVCKPNWQRYAERHGYDLICIDQPLDHTPRVLQRSPAWQKCLVLSQPFSRNYERLVWVDLDILINPEAPDIADGVPLDKVGAVDEYSIPTPALHRQTLAKLYRYWDAAGMPYVRTSRPKPITWPMALRMASRRLSRPVFWCCRQRIIASCWKGSMRTMKTKGQTGTTRCARSPLSCSKPVALPG